MHDTANERASLGPDRDDVTPVANRDDVFLECRPVSASTHEAVEPVHQAVVGDPDRLAEPSELLAGAVEDIPARADRSRQVRFQRRKVVDRFGELEEVGKALLDIRHAREGSLDLSPGP